MQTGLLSRVSAANTLTARWCATAGATDFALSGAGIWPLLAILCAAADGPARRELADAVGMPATSAHAEARQLLDTLGDATAVAAALGVWVRPDLTLRDDWLGSLPAGVVAPLAGQRALDAWAAEHTGGLIDRFPARITPDISVLLATALVARTTWVDRFHDDVLEPGSGPWHGHRGPGLARYTGRLSDAAVLVTPDPVTRVVVRGRDDLDVHLLLGDGTPGGILAAGAGALDGSVPVSVDLRVGTTAPGLTVRAARAQSDALRIQLPPFDIHSSHRLLDRPELFGLVSATDSNTGHFPALSDTPLYVADAAQDVRARFTWEGFEAAAVSAVAVAIAAGYRRSLGDTRQVAVVFDRPFGFLAVHRPTGLIIVAGWVATPPA